ncbi:MAG: ATP-binding protein, partial [Bacteroidales bacterium]|nr:ATP-binding protein [Bacteroidales bacterium]
MGYLKRLVLVNSAGYGFAEVRLDGHCDMAGGQGVGKTTLLNAIVYPFVVEDRYIDIDRKEKQIFSSYYFPKANSFVIYEVVNNKDVPYCIIIHKTGASLNFHFVSAPYDEEWLYEGERQVRTWSEIKSKLDAEGISVRHEDTAKQFNNIFLGRGGAYMEQYSIIRSPENKDSIRPLISAIFKNLPFTQETLKEALVASVMMDNQVTSEGIDLASHRRNLSDF